MFLKNDNEFKCINCGKKVERLKYTSRDHCNHCLYSLHVDITPGDRENTCKRTTCTNKRRANIKKRKSTNI